MNAWKQGCATGGEKYVFAPGIVKPINAGAADRAELIVRAVNSHGALVSALEGMLREFVDPNQPLTQFDSAIVRKEVELARVALARAKEQSK